eukprot:2102815-Prymnesium_polylepis.1
MLLEHLAAEIVMLPEEHAKDVDPVDGVPTSFLEERELIRIDQEEEQAPTAQPDEETNALIEWYTSADKGVADRLLAGAC